ncbi:hypothetical protein B0H13DRAFT_2262156 [Mycena leptocephala]|nr:hypothetical protein B0H13DRAFT_2262156 [Mycena leptocephala]
MSSFLPPSSLLLPRLLPRPPLLSSPHLLAFGPPRLCAFYSFRPWLATVTISPSTSSSNSPASSRRHRPPSSNANDENKPKDDRDTSGSATYRMAGPTAWTDRCGLRRAKPHQAPPSTTASPRVPAPPVYALLAETTTTARPQPHSSSITDSTPEGTTTRRPRGAVDWGRLAWLHAAVVLSSYSPPARLVRLFSAPTVESHLRPHGTLAHRHSDTPSLALGTSRRQGTTPTPTQQCTDAHRHRRRQGTSPPLLAARLLCFPSRRSSPAVAL